MSTPSLLFTLALATALAAPSAARAEPRSGKTPCFLAGGRIERVKPYYGRSTLRDAALRPLRGAEVLLAPATRLSSEHLEERLERLLESRRRAPLPACLQDVGHVHIESDTLGRVASVRLIARDPSDAEDVFHRARRMVNR